MKHAAIAVAIAVVVVGGLVFYFGFYATGGNLNVMVKDPLPAGWSAVYVNITSISIHNSTAQSSHGYTRNFSPAIEVNLANAVNSEQFLTSLKLPAGHYQMVRLTVASAYGVYNGKTYEISVLNGSVDMPGQFTISNMQTTTIVLDFDSAAAIHGSPMTGFTMTPNVSLIVQ